MRTVPKIGQRVCFTQGTDVYEGVVVKHDNYHPVKKVLVRWDNPPPGLGKTSWESCSALSRPAKKLSKDKQRIAELDDALLYARRFIKELEADIINCRSIIDGLKEEHAKMKKLLSGETLWLGRTPNGFLIGCQVTDRKDIPSHWTVHTKVLVLETKAAGEV